MFNHPKWPFVTAIPAPTVTFSSSKLVQRHVNAYLLGKFLREEIGTTQKEKLFLSLEWFYLKLESQKAIYERFIDWLSAKSTAMKSELDVLVRGHRCHHVLKSSYVTTLRRRWNP